jgi:hypothetical protein
MSFKNTFLRAEVVADPLHEVVIRRDLIANLDKLAPQLADEISAAVDELWGCDAENYKTVSLEETLFRILARASSRIFVGEVVCKSCSSILMEEEKVRCRV